MPACVLNVLQGGARLKLERDGLFSPNPRASFILEAQIEHPDRPIYAIFVDGNGNVVPKSSIEAPKSAIRHYQLSITPDMSGTSPRLLKMQNIMRFAILDPKTASVQMLDVVVACQNECFFVVQQVSRTATAFRIPQSNIVCYPELSNWAQLHDFLSNQVQADQFELRDANEFVPPLSLRVPEDEHLAAIEWFSYAQGFGLARFKGGVARVHWESIKPNGSRFVHLDHGDTVRYGRVGLPTQRSAKATKFRHELFDVELVPNP